MYGIAWRDILGMMGAIIAATVAFLAAGPALSSRLLVGGGVLVFLLLLVLLRVPPDMVPLETFLVRRLRAMRTPRRYVFRAPLPEPPPESPPPAPAPEPAPAPAPAPAAAPAIPVWRVGGLAFLVPAEAIFWIVALTGLLWSALSILGTGGRP